ncbi:hypothetical protein C8F04DRAFT_56368 [Mycena alexandri]|uniref:Uncharacterized protein n=1 Tax=Mycena alexandri TaxID=1745969 RepID=A0AAD6TBI8_9AGAR|nr:hypothetical protein C8F04DRAFT_56368 [Mycena alexandri]
MVLELSAYDYRFHKKPSDAAAVSLCRHLISLRDLAISAPLERGMQFMLNLQFPPQNRHPAARQVPSTLTADRFQSATVTLQLDTALQSGCDRFSQVWTATAVGVPETCLVMKIIQPSLCLLPDPSNIHWREAYYNPLDLAHNEAWVYRKLAHRQGLSIPYFFGIFDIVTPSGEAAWVLVLEFIQGPTIHNVAKSMSTDTVHDFCTLGLNAVRDLALSGWTLRDMSGRYDRSLRHSARCSTSNVGTSRNGGREAIL